MSLLTRALVGAKTARDRVFDSDAGSQGCGCRASFREASAEQTPDRVTLDVDADGCPHGGELATSPGCRRTVVEALTDRDADIIRITDGGEEHVYADRGAAFLLAAGRFREQVRFHESRLAKRVATDPLGAAREASGRAGPPNRIAAETGLSEIAATVETGYEGVLRPYTAPRIAAARVAARPPPGAALVERWETGTGATVRLYDGDGPLRTYHLTPPEADLGPASLGSLADARDRLLAGEAGGERAPGRAVRAVANENDPVPALVQALRKHTRGYGVLDDVFTDSRVTDAVLSPPVAETPLRVVVDGERLTTNVRLSPKGAATLASRLRRASGNGFSRATPTLDATLETSGGPVRVAATTEPASDGLGFAFRRGADDPWTLPRLVANGTMSPAAAGFLSIAVERGVSGLVAGGRGAGKTSTLGALLWELSPETRTVLVEDTPELPASALRNAGRDVQRLYTGSGARPSPTEAVRTALRLGDGALVVGEVRGEEAAALYEAMRVGAGGDTVLGTIHGASGPEVRERVVSDLGVPASAFASTDLLVMIANHEVDAVCEVQAGNGRAEVGGTLTASDVRFEALFHRSGSGLDATGRLDRGNCGLVADLATPGESYAAVVDEIEQRADAIEGLVETNQTRASDVASAVVDRSRSGGNGSPEGGGVSTRGGRVSGGGFDT